MKVCGLINWIFFIIPSCEIEMTKSGVLTYKFIKIVILKGEEPDAPQFFDLQERLSTSLDDFQKQLDLIVKNDWDFDHYLEEDVPAVVRWQFFGINENI